MKKTRCLVSRIILQRNNRQMRIIYCCVKMVLDAKDPNPIHRYDLHSSTSRSTKKGISEGVKAVEELVPDSEKVVRLIYTDSGLAVLALASNTGHKLWKWQHSDRNPSGKVSFLSMELRFLLKYSGLNI